MLKVNGIDIEEGYCLDVVSDSNDTRERAFSNFKYTKPYFDGTKVNIQQFKKNGTPIDFCLIGGRPSFTLRLESKDWDFSPNYIIQKPEYDTRSPNPKEQYAVYDPASSRPTDSDIIYNTHMIIEIISGGGGGSGGGALLAGVGGGAGGYILLLIDTTKFGYREFVHTRTYSRLLIYGDTLNNHDGAGSSNRGQANQGRDIYIEYHDRSQSTDGEFRRIVTIHGGGGANAGDVGIGGSVEIAENLPECVTVLAYANGLNGAEGVSGSTITCPQTTVSIGFDSEGDNYKLTRGGFSSTTDGGGAGAGAPSQFGNGGYEGTTSNGYDGGTPDSTAYGAGGGGGHGRAFSSSTGGNGALWSFRLYY